MKISSSKDPTFADVLDQDAFTAASDDAARFLRSMGHGPRLRILCLLLEEARSSGELARTLGMREAAASQQLALLRAERLIEAKREGQHVIYTIANPAVAQIVGILRDTFCK